MNNDLNKTNIFLQARAVSKRLQQLSFNFNELEKRFSYGNMTEADQAYLLKTYLQARFDLEAMARDLERIAEEQTTSPSMNDADEHEG